MTLVARRNDVAFQARTRPVEPGKRRGERLAASSVIVISDQPGIPTARRKRGPGASPYNNMRPCLGAVSSVRMRASSSQSGPRSPNKTIVDYRAIMPSH